MSKIEEEIGAVITPAIARLGYEVVEIKFAQKPQRALTVYIDCPAGVGLDDCERVSREIDPMLDELDPVEGAYVLNVSSPGLDRPIRSAGDYERNRGREVEARLYAPLPSSKTKIVTGVLEGREGDVVRIRAFDGGTVELRTAQIALLTRLIRFE